MRSQAEAMAHYLQTRYQQADAITPGQKLAVIETLQRELHQLGRVPLPDGPVRVDVNHEAVQAALSGRAVSLGGQPVAKQAGSGGQGLAGLPTGHKVGILAGIFFIPLIAITLWLISGRNAAASEEAGTVTATMTITPEGATLADNVANVMLGAVGIDPGAAATATPAPTQTPVPTPLPPATLPPPQLLIVTPTPFPALQLHQRGDVAAGGDDPASLEIAGFAYILTTGQVRSGLWQPRGAEWLVDTSLRRVIAVPYEADLLTALFDLLPHEVIRLRLRSGEVTRYQLTEVIRVGQTEIEVLAGKRPSMAIILYGEETDTRWVVLGEAVQEEPDFAPVNSPAQPQPLTVIEGNTITTEELVLVIEACVEVATHDGQPPPGSQQRFIRCTLTLTAITAAAYDSRHLTISERTWADATWLPFALNQGQAGQLAAGETLTVTLTGIVNQGSGSEPVLIWEKDGKRYISGALPQE